MLQNPDSLPQLVSWIQAAGVVLKDAIREPSGSDPLSYKKNLLAKGRKGKFIILNRLYIYNI